MSDSLAVEIASAGRTHVGKVRKLNEDSFLNCPEKGLWAVADGMGGLSRGERASGLIVERLKELVLPDELDRCVALISNALESVNAELRQDMADGICGSTVVVLIVRERRFACVWAGDSRLYRMAKDRLVRLSKDHSVVEQLVDAGAITPDQARLHPMSNQITRAVGTENVLKLDVLRGRLRPGDRLMLCTDGLHGMVERIEMERLADLGNSDEATATLIEAALAGGGKDNISVVIVDIAPDTDFDTTLVNG